ncbi:hypothetical protein [Membranihabitans maritimus]|uniref:hypothetical protein n=1 Tax=Membranihabitans maritimus TaxID=2904244 RepID=UPI001F22F54C|nr:hypothetical protein [Membranihabitans maritimus]
MRIVINLLLLAGVVILGYLTYNSIKLPIEFKNELDRRERRVIQQLMKIRNAQDVYRDITNGSYANSWGELKDTLKTGQLKFINIIGDPDDPDFDPAKLVRDTTYKPAIDTINAMGITLDSLEYIPYSNGETFSLDADTLTYQSTLVNVVEVKTSYDKFMGPFADIKYSMYDKMYSPQNVIKFGDMNKPTTAGSWDK